MVRICTRLLLKRLQVLLAVMLLLCGPALTAHAQSDTGRVVGNVSDSTGGVIPGAVITVTNVDNGNILKGSSNGTGEFNILAVPRGNYKAAVSAPGFQSQAQSFTLDVTQTQTLLFKLSAGAVTTTVDVTSELPLVDTSSPTMGETIQGKQLTDLPLNGLNFTNLALLVPGVTQGAYGNGLSGVSNDAESFRNNQSGGASLSVNGLPPSADNYLLDGIDNNDNLVNTLIFFPPVYATDQFQVNTSIAPAQYGRAGGAIVISSIKSGTNSIHGNAFEYYRSGKFDSNPYYQFPGESFTAAPPDNRNVFGGDIGLPIIKDHLFLFGDYQGTRENSPKGAAQVTVPTALMRTGDFSELLNPALNPSPFNSSLLCQPSGATSGIIYDPITCQQFSYGGKLNVIDPARLNPAAVNYLNAFPLPSIPNQLYNNYVTHEQQVTSYNQFDVRLDWRPEAVDSFFFRFSYDNSVENVSSEFPSLPAGNGTGASYVHARGYDLGYNHVFTPNLVNEARIGYNRDNYGYQPPFYGDPVSANLGIVNANRNQETSGGALIGGDSYELEFTGDYGLYAVPQNNIEVADTVDWDHRNNSFKFGGSFIHRQTEYFRPIDGKGFFQLSANYNNVSDFTGYQPADLLASFADSYSIGSQNGYFANNSQEDAVFGQDDWRVSKRLTVNLGLRWDLITWPYEEHNQQASFDINTGDVLLAGQNGVSRSIINQDYHYFGPRVGFAYDAFGNGRTALRGGYGIYYFPTYGGVGNQLGQQPPFGGDVDYESRLGYCITFTGQTPAPGTNSYASCKVPAQNQTTPLPQPGFPNFDPTSPPAGLSTVAVNRNNQYSDIQEWNLQLQQQLARHDVVDIAYAANSVRHLADYYPYNQIQFGGGVGPAGAGQQPFPTLGGITYENFNGIANYNSLQLQYTHREKNLVTTAAYTWSHTLDNQCGTLCLYYDPNASYGNSGQDQRNAFTFSSIYTLPFGRGQAFGTKVPRPVDWAIGGWQLNLIAILQSGQPFDLSTGNTNTANEPDQIGPISYPKTLTHWFNPAAFSTNIPTETANGQPVYTRLGTARRDEVYGPGYRPVNFGIQKDIHLTERYSLDLRGDAFNVFNTPEFTNPGATVSNSSFGVINSVRYQSNRQLQLEARFDF